MYTASIVLSKVSDYSCNINVFVIIIYTLIIKKKKCTKKCLQIISKPGVARFDSVLKDGPFQPQPDLTNKLPNLLPILPPLAYSINYGVTKMFS